MLSFSGRNGRLYWLGEPIRVREALLEDCGDGFDWRLDDPALRFWPREDDLVFEVQRDGAWQREMPRELYPWSGRVGFARSLAGPVRLNGSVCPLTLAARAERWQLEVEHSVASEQSLGVSDGRPQTMTGAAAVRLAEYRAEPLFEGGQVLACLLTAEGAFLGLGDSHANGATIQVVFNGKGVRYDPL